VQNVHLLIGAQCSRYSARARSYLVKKGVPYVERVPTAWTFFVSIARRFGTGTIPVVIAPSGEWLVDSNLIIDRLEAERPAHPVAPSDGVQALFCALADAWGSEMWLPVDMATRWLDRGNYPWWREELGEGFFDGLPKALKNALCDLLARKFAAYVPLLGGGAPAVEAWMNRMMDALDAHLAEHPYLLGQRATRADFGLICPFFGHLARDPSSIPFLQRRPHLHAWVWRMQQPYLGAEPPPLPAAGAPLPATLAPIVRSLFADMVPFAEATLAALAPALSRARAGERLPKQTGMIEYPLGGATHRRVGVPIILWYLQRARDLLAALPAGEAERALRWLSDSGGARLLELRLPRVELIGGRTLRVLEDARSATSAPARLRAA
jgi:glutathione S-transferase